MNDQVKQRGADTGVATPDGLSKYQHIKRWLAAQISAGEFPVGQRILSEHKLMKLHGVSRGPVRQAMNELVIEGYIHRTQGKGTFVADNPSALPEKKTMQWTILCRYGERLSHSRLQGLDAYTRELGAHLIVEYVGDDHDRAAQAIARMIDQEVAGIIVEPLPYEAEPTRLYGPIVDAGIPLVLTHQPVPGIEAPLVTVDHELIGRQAAQHLLDMGHRRIAYVSSPRYWVVDRQIKGYHSALAAARIKPRDEWISLEQSFSENRGFDATRKLLDLPKPPTAIIALNTLAAANAYRAIKLEGLDIPTDVSVLASGGTYLSVAEALEPPLTVWCSPKCGYRLGRTAGEVLEALIEKQWPEDTNEILIDPAPVPRGSVCRARDRVRS